ncbi:hypothetical protein Glove_318g36 [Diversispora epigaea]|uniref:Uncharacterized protein n=1 Tax=Diversispora epigaea TaxID=1348612 RepID=A0A397HW03_9GLOM|nr:hypothetical protein Glove_318g36 [Diversispora epigaea]
MIELITAVSVGISTFSISTPIIIYTIKNCYLSKQNKSPSTSENIRKKTFGGGSEGDYEMLIGDSIHPVNSSSSSQQNTITSCKKYEICREEKNCIDNHKFRFEHYKDYYYHNNHYREYKRIKKNQEKKILPCNMKPMLMLQMEKYDELVIIKNDNQCC